MRKFLLLITITVFLMMILVCLKNCNNYENFGSTSPGTMVQLQTSHVPTGEDVNFYENIYPKMVRRDITNMTGGDPGELRPWYGGLYLN